MCPPLRSVPEQPSALEVSRMRHCSPSATARTPPLSLDEFNHCACASGPVCPFVGAINKVLVSKDSPFPWQHGGVRLDYSHRALFGSAFSLSVAWVSLRKRGERGFEREEVVGARAMRGKAERPWRYPAAWHVWAAASLVPGWTGGTNR